MNLLLIIVFTEYLVQLLGYDDLSYGKESKQSPYVQCIPESACVATNAVDRDISTCTRTDFIGPSAPVKTTWWYVDLGDVYSVYSIRILFKILRIEYVNRQRGRFAGFSLYLSNTVNKEDGHLCYKDGPQLPPLDFITNCTGHASHVIFYNDRLDGMVYPEGYQLLIGTQLCEVIVKGCTRGTYDKLCNKHCSGHCQGNSCDIIDGSCLGCMSGWSGKFCQTPCQGGTYGPECKYRCTGHCKDGLTCNSMSGICDEGCASGWTRPMCNESCSNGRYGPNCAFNCSGHCLNGNTCNKETGHCDSGCTPGYTEDFFDKKEGTYLHSESMSARPPIIGAVFGACAFVAMLIVLVVLLRRKRILRTWIEGRHSNITSMEASVAQKHDSHVYQGLADFKDKGNYVNFESSKDYANTYQELHLPKDKGNYVNMELETI